MIRISRTKLANCVIIEEFLLRVRNLGVDEDPKYDELLSLLASGAESCMHSLSWPDSAFPEPNPTIRSTKTPASDDEVLTPKRPRYT